MGEVLVDPEWIKITEIAREVIELWITSPDPSHSKEEK